MAYDLGGFGAAGYNLRSKTSKALVLTPDQINLLTACFTGLAALTSVAVVWATFRVTKATEASVEVLKAQHRAATRPYVEISVYPRTGTTMLMLAVKNTGSSAAENVRLIVDRDFFYNAEEGPNTNIRTFPAFKDVIASLGPRAELKFNLGIGARVLNNPTLCPKKFAIAANYSFAGEHVSETTPIDLAPFVRTVAHEEPIVEQMRRIADNSGKIFDLMNESPI
ncbi:MAG: hypothetical protein EON58_19900 [Alphaproteobacteria bacterium]|nr:MAG: hypothetical protein EON58_19900 [Alphaproteobacteria bacterium]